LVVQRVVRNERVVDLDVRMRLLELRRHAGEIVGAVAGLLLEQVVQRHRLAAGRAGAAAALLARPSAGGEVEREARRCPGLQELAATKAPPGRAPLPLRHLTHSSNWVPDLTKAGVYGR